MRLPGVEQCAAIKAGFDSTPRLDTSRHGHYSTYLDGELRGLPAQREAALIER